MGTQKFIVMASMAAFAAGCGGALPDQDGGVDGGQHDGGAHDAGFDGGEMDGGETDGGAHDGGHTDPTWDGGVFDGGTWDGGAVQMNDVSILFPLSDSLLPASSVGAHGALLTPALYAAVGPITGSTFDGPPLAGAVGRAEFQDLRVVALRIDPCFAALAPDPHGAGCLNQLRLIMQEAKASSGLDGAMHLFYSLDRDELLGLVRDLGKLRASGSGDQLGALTPHPLMLQQGASAAMAVGVKQLILQHAGVRRLTRITVLNGTQPGFAWDFSGFDIEASGTARPMQIPKVSARKQTLFSGFASTTAAAVFMPETTHADNFAGLANLDRSLQLTPAQRSAEYDGLLRIENPTKHSPDTIDCASCHFSIHADLIIARPRYQLTPVGNPNAWLPTDPTLNTQLEPMFQRGGAFNVHAFSYFGAEAGINQRTVNETAAVVEYLNANR